MEESQRKKIFQNELNLLDANVDQISTQLAFKQTLNSKAVWLQRLKEDYLNTYIKVYDRKIENGLAIRIVTKVRLESDRVFFLLRAVRVILSECEADLRDLFQEPTLDYELERHLSIMYNIFEDTDLEWNEIYDQFDPKRFLNKLLFALPERFADPRMSTILRFDFQGVDEPNVATKRVIQVLFNLVLLTDRHYDLFVEVEKMNRKIGKLQRQQTQLEKEEIDLRLKISNINNLIETMDVKSQLIEEEIEAVDAEVELKNHMLSVLHETGSLDLGLLPQEGFEGLNLTPKELERYALDNIPDSIKINLELKREGMPSEDDLFTLADHIFGFKRGSIVKESAEEKGGRPATFGRQRSNKFEGKNETPDGLKMEEEISPIENDTGGNSDHKNLNEEDIEANFEVSIGVEDLKAAETRQDYPKEDSGLRFHSARPTHLAEQKSLSRTTPTSNPSRIGKWESFNTNVKAKKELSATGNSYQRRKSDRSTKLLDVFAFLRKKCQRPNLLLKSLYSKHGSSGVTSNLLVETAKTNQPTVSNGLSSGAHANNPQRGTLNQPGKPGSSGFNFDTFQNIDNNLKTISTSHRDANHKEVSLDCREEEDSPEFPIETSSDDIQGFDFLKRSFHQKHANFNDFQIMTNSNLFPDPKNNSSVMHDEFLKEIDDEIKKYDNAEFLKSSYFKDSEKHSQKSSKFVGNDLTRYRKSPFAASRLGQVNAPSDAFSDSASNDNSPSNVSPVLADIKYQPFDFKTEEDKSAFETLDFNRKEQEDSPGGMDSVNDNGVQTLKNMIDHNFAEVSPSHQDGRKHGRSVDHRFTGKDHLGEPLGSSRTASRRNLTKMIGQASFVIVSHKKEKVFSPKVKKLTIESVHQGSILSFKALTATKSSSVFARTIDVKELPPALIQMSTTGRDSSQSTREKIVSDVQLIFCPKKKDPCRINSAIQTDPMTSFLFNSFTEPRTTVSGTHTPTKSRAELKLDSLGKETGHLKNTCSREARFGSLMAPESHWKRSTFDGTSHASSGSVPRQNSRSPYRGVVFENAVPQQKSRMVNESMPSLGHEANPPVPHSTPVETPKVSGSSTRPGTFTLSSQSDVTPCFPRDSHVSFTTKTETATSKNDFQKPGSRPFK
jgi:hypothetical protein